MSQPQVRPEIEDLPTYKAGKQVDAVAGLIPYKLSSNENAFAPSPAVLSAIIESASNINRYPDPFATALTKSISTKFDVPEAMIATGTGSVGVCQQIIQATCASGDEVMFAWRSFEAYPIITKIAGAINLEVSLKQDASHDLDAMAKAVTSATRVIFICTPNNPTGNVVSQSEVDEFLKKVPKSVLVIIDEAYVEFNRDPAAVNGLATVKANTNVGLLRTFSKAYGLAGLRVGYFIGPENVAEAVRKTAVPFGVSNIAQSAAVACLEHEEELLENVEAIVQKRNWFERELHALGVDFVESQANFVWLPVGKDTEAFTKLCAEYALAVRPFAGEGVRISIGEQAGLDRVLEVIKVFQLSKNVST